MYKPQDTSEDRKKAWMITIVIHVLLILFSLFYGLTQPDPLPEERGVEIAMGSLGDTPTGFGEQIPTKVENTPEPVKTPEPTPEPEVVQPTPEPVTSDDSEIAVPKKEEKKEEKKPVEKPKKEVPEVKEEPKKVIDPNSLYSKKTETDSKSTYPGGSKGSSVGQGNEGTPDGVPVGKGALGGGGGSWELSGRSLTGGVRIPDTKEEGTVVLNIWVDRNGNVVRTTPNLGESTTTSEYLFSMAEKAALKTRYSVKASAAVEQRGKMTFVFILK